MFPGEGRNLGQVLVAHFCPGGAEALHYFGHVDRVPGQHGVAEKAQTGGLPLITQKKAPTQFLFLLATLKRGLTLFAGFDSSPVSKHNPEQSLLLADS